MKTVQAARVCDLAPMIGNGELVALNVGPDLQLYAVIALKDLDYRDVSSGGVFAKTMPDTPQSYRVIALRDGDVTLEVDIASERFNIHDVQPLPNNELLLVCCRSCYRGPNDFDRNGRVYSSDGQLIREILLGDGIEQVQATSAGTIWTSFFDEGVFGNYGWDDPVGSSGLAAWDAQGTRLYDFQPDDGLDAICDCYAMNVESDSSTWLYYYTEFPLVHLRNQRIEAIWSMPVAGSSAFAVSGEFALFTGGYDQRDICRLFELSRDRSIRETAQFTLTDEHHKQLDAERVLARSNTLYVARKNQVYRCDIQMAAEA